jgi:hypothetical protein
MTLPAPPVPTLALRALELRALKLPGAALAFESGRALRYRFSIAPGEFSRTYDCLLRITPDSRMPEMFVLAPNLSILAGARELPHIYPNWGAGTKLCLWWPKRPEWTPQHKLGNTYIPWTAEWLWYFEDWLTTDIWAGGGEHPDSKRKRWAPPNTAI